MNGLVSIFVLNCFKEVSGKMRRRGCEYQTPKTREILRRLSLWLLWALDLGVTVNVKARASASMVMYR